MKSIRASLIVYFWMLLALGLGGASVLAYRIAADSLRTKQEANRQLLEAQFEDRERDEKLRFDDLLLAKARFVATKVRTDFQARTSVLVQCLTPLALMGESQAALASVVSTQTQSPHRSQ